ncbi:enoyl-CoA hydratase/isomerase [Hypoxylon sp. NC1633]|nr:enoyl-CoA hydratase/isomerase [Hypoxylon sp. NC1633]
MPPTETPPPPTETLPPPTPEFLRLSYPAPRVLLVRMDQPPMNDMSTAAQWEMDAVWKWFDREPSLSVAIITGSNAAFSVGVDLEEWNADPTRRMGNAPAFMPLSRRLGKKPVIAAVNGVASGAGFELVVNCDIVVAGEESLFALPEIKRGVAAIGGALPRLSRSIGLQRASELALTGRNVKAQEMFLWGLVNRVVAKKQVVDSAIIYANMIARNSLDAIICTRAAVEWTLEKESAELQRGENILEGLKAFAEKREPQRKRSKL